jgi:hypothetical protein
VAVPAALRQGVDHVDPHRSGDRTADGCHRDRLVGRLRLLRGVPVLGAHQVMRGLSDAEGPLRGLPQDGAAIADQLVRHVRGRADPFPRLDPERGQPVDEQPPVGGRHDAEPAGRPRSLRCRPGARTDGRGGCGDRRRSEPVHAKLPVHPDGRALPLAPRRRERVRRLDRRVYAADVPPKLRQRPGEHGGHLRCPPGDEQRHGRIMDESTPCSAPVRRLPPAVEHSAFAACAADRRASTRRLPDDLRGPTGPDGERRREQHRVLGRPRPQVALGRRRELVQVRCRTPAHGVMLPVVRSCQDRPGFSGAWQCLAVGRRVADRNGKAAQQVT